MGAAGIEHVARVLPDGEWIVCQWPFPDVDGGRWQVSPTSGSGSMPVWNPRRSEIFYRDGLAQIVTRVLSENPFAVGGPARLFEGSEISGWHPPTDPSFAATPAPS